MGNCLATAFFQELGDHSLLLSLAIGGDDVMDPSGATLGIEDTIERPEERCVPRDVGEKAAPPLKLDARRKAAVVAEIFIVKD